MVKDSTPSQANIILRSHTPVREQANQHLDGVGGEAQPSTFS